MLATAILVIIMLNLLISIVGNSFNFVTGLQKHNFMFERASIIYEIDLELDMKDTILHGDYLFFSKCEK